MRLTRPFRAMGGKGHGKGGGGKGKRKEEDEEAWNEEDWIA